MKECMNTENFAATRNDFFSRHKTFRTDAVE